MKNKIKGGLTSKSVRIFIGSSIDPNGGGLTLLNFQTPGLSGYYFRDGDTAPINIPLASGILGTYTPSGFVEVHSTSMPGTYEIGVPNNAISGRGTVNMMFFGALNMVPCRIEMELDGIDYQTSIPDSVWLANPSGYLIANTMGSGVNKTFQDIYYASIKPVNNVSVPNNEWGVSWFKNVYPISSGQIQNPAITVYNTITGTALFANRTLSFVPNISAMNYVDSTNMMVSGVPYLVITSGTIDGILQRWHQVVGLDIM